MTTKHLDITSANHEIIVAKRLIQVNKETSTEDGGQRKLEIVLARAPNPGRAVC